MDEKNNQYVEIDLMEILALLKSRWLIIALVTILCGVIGFFGTKYFITPQYESSVNMIVNTRTDTQVNSNVSSDNINSAKSLVSTYAIIIKSNIVLNQVISNLDLDMDYNDLADKVSVNAIDDTQVMKISVTDPDPELATQIVVEIAKISPDEIVNSVEAGSCKVVSQVSVSEGPVSPSKAKNTAIAALIGLVVTVAIIIIHNLLSSYIVDDEDIQKYLDLPVLGVIPEVKGDK